MTEFFNNHEYLRCVCGGAIVGHKKVGFQCEDCNTQYNLQYKIDYDTIETNYKTGWIFPLRYKETSCDSCLSNPKNGGSGICHCTLANKGIY